MKKCNVCGKELPDSEFMPDKRSKDGLKSVCKACLHKKKKDGMTPREMMKELYRRGYTGILEFREKKKTHIVHNGHEGEFEYIEVHKINLEKL